MQKRLLKCFCIYVWVIYYLCACDMGQTDIKPVVPNSPEEEPKPIRTLLTIRNQSFSDLLDVSWNNEDFEENNLEHTINTGRFVTKEVSPGIGYIYFKREVDVVAARTDAAIIVNEGDNIEFTFTDNTIILEKNNTTNKGTLGTLESKIVFFDDAEGDLQQYDELREKVFYYTSETKPLRCKLVKNGNKSIAIGGIKDPAARIVLSVNMKQPGEVSFWYANYSFSSVSGQLRFSIDDEEKISVGNVEWSFKSFPLSAGIHTLCWVGGYEYGTNTYYSSLDDIRIVYTN